MKKITAFVLALIMLLSVFGCTKKESGSSSDAAGSSGDSPAVWSELTVVTESMFAYYYNGYYRYFLESNSDSLSYLGLDPSKSLSSQQQSEQYTWQQYITIQVYSQLREMIALADAAKSEKIKLDKADKKEIKEQISAYDSLAKEAGMDVDEYIVKVYGKGVTKDVMEEALNLRFLANKYYKKLWEGYSFSDEECLEYYEANRNSFLHYDYIKITVPAEDVPQLEAAEDEEAFVEAMRQIITKNNFVGDYERFSDTIEKQIAKKYYYRADYDASSVISKWAVEEDRKPYDIHTKEESTGDITVSMILPTNDPGAVNEVLYRDDQPVRNLKYIAFDDEGNTTGKVKAESIYKNWQEKPTEERFDELVSEYDGGTAEGVTRGMFNDNVNDWIFSEERKAGDCEVIEVDGGAYLIYMLENGDPSWLTDVRNALKDAAYAEDVNKAIDTYPTEYDPDIVYNIVEVSVVESGAADTAAQ